MSQEVQHFVREKFVMHTSHGISHPSEAKRHPLLKVVSRPSLDL